MTTLRGSYLRVVYKGEIYFAIGQSEVTVPTISNPEGFLIIPTALIVKVENTTHLKTPIKVIEALPYEVFPLASEIPTWLHIDFPIDLGI